MASRTWLRSPLRSSDSGLGRHFPLILVLVPAAVVRTLAEVAYWPALFFSDSWEYVRLAYSKPLAAFGIDRPSGYPLIIHLLSLPGRHLGLLTIVQHIAGLAVGVVAYSLLVRLGVNRWIAALSSALILFDSYSIALEQFIMADTFFAFSLFLSAYLAVFYYRRPLPMAASGLLLAGAATIRLAGLFAIPVFLIYVLLKSLRRPAVLAAATAALALPLVLYAELHAAHGNGFGFTQTGSWTLYGRVAPIADCHGADIPPETRPLCQTAADRARHWIPSKYVFSPESPARLLFGWNPSPTYNQLLRRFAIAIVVHRPFAYLKMVSGDLARLVEPGQRIDIPLLFPRKDSFTWESQPPLRGVKDQYFPHYRRHVRKPAGFLRWYQRWFHTPRWLIGIFVVAIAAMMLATLVGRKSLDSTRRHAVLFLGGLALSVVVGATATVEFNIRYLVPVVPLLVCGGVLTLYELARQVGRLRARTREADAPAGS